MTRIITLPRLLTVLLALAPALLPGKALAHQTIEAIIAYALETTPGMSNGAAYITLKNHGPSDAEIMGVDSAVARDTQLHHHVRDGDRMRMAALPLPLELADEAVLDMAPGGIHVMLLGLNQPLTAGETFTVEIGLDGRHTRPLKVEVPILTLEDVRGLGILGKDTMEHDSMEHDSMDHEGQKPADSSHSSHNNH